MGEKDGGGGENQARNTTRRDQTRVSHTVSKLCLFFFGERRESTPTLFRDWGNFSNYPVLKWRAIGSIFFPFFSTYGCSSTREFEGVDRGVRFARALKILRVRPSTSAFPYPAKGMDGWNFNFAEGDNAQGERNRFNRTNSLTFTIVIHPRRQPPSSLFLKFDALNRDRQPSEFTSFARSSYHP